MKTLYIDCGMGAAGNMLTAALLELVPSPDEMIEQLNGIGIPGVRFQKSIRTKCGISGTHIAVTVNGVEEGSHEHLHMHGDHHGHDHDHGGNCDRQKGMHEIHVIINELKTLPQKIRNDIIAVYNLLAEAESKVHNEPVNKIHFDEIGNMDAIADIAAVCMLMNRIAPDQVIVSPIHVGSGQVKCAHGILPVPAPATAYILCDAPIYGGTIKGELCTPTGAALLKHFATSFGNMPVMETRAIGYGMGTKDFEAANCVRAFLGESAVNQNEIIELKCNLDDMTPEAIGFVQELLFEAGALDVFTIPIGMKKSRQGVLLCCLCREADLEKFVYILQKNTSTLGVRATKLQRFTLNRRIEEVETEFGIVRMKISTGKDIEKFKPEFEDICKISKENNLTFLEAAEFANEAYRIKAEDIRTNK